ncbi:MAG: iron chelate uptake ABC transporter family permease subunit [Gammaproteobacteria bacterium]
MGFVGLAVPNAVRALVGNDYRWVLPLSAVYGAVFVIATNLAAQVLLRPATIETGVAIAFIGAPIFLFLVSRRRLHSYEAFPHRGEIRSASFLGAGAGARRHRHADTRWRRRDVITRRNALRLSRHADIGCRSRSDGPRKSDGSDRHPRPAPCHARSNAWL